MVLVIVMDMVRAKIVQNCSLKTIEIKRCMIWCLIGVRSVLQDIDKSFNSFEPLTGVCRRPSSFEKCFCFRWGSLLARAHHKTVGFLSRLQPTKNHFKCVKFIGSALREKEESLSSLLSTLKLVGETFINASKAQL